MNSLFYYIYEIISRGYLKNKKSLVDVIFGGANDRPFVCVNIQAMNFMFIVDHVNTVALVSKSHVWMNMGWLNIVEAIGVLQIQIGILCLRRVQGATWSLHI